ncbi:MAG: crossover junction endodeoxyribonuclease RuvC [Verrucomicrobiota bacterium]
MRVLAIDPALRKTGFAVLEATAPNTSPAVLTYGTHVNKPSLRQSLCFVEIRTRVSELIEEFNPEVCAIESVIYVQSYKTAIILGAARGAAVTAAAAAGLEIREYAPRRVKQAVVGKGAADKSQVAFMIRALLGLTETPEPDAADALAIGVAHIQSNGGGDLV